MNTQKTLDGQTAGFIAAVANALSRNITAQRQEDLISNPQILERLLLPLADDGWQHLLPFVTDTTINPRNTVSWLHGDYSRDVSGKEHYPLRKIMRSAADASLRFMTEEQAKHFCQLLSGNEPSVQFQFFFGHSYKHHFVFQREHGKYGSWSFDPRTKIPEVSEFGIDYVFPDQNAHFFFLKSFDGSEMRFALEV